MSGLYLIALVAIWLFLSWAIYRVWHFWKPSTVGRKSVHIVIGLILLSSWFGWTFWEVAGKKMYWDAKVRQLCAKDGGIKVYETVELPAHLYNQYAKINWIFPEKSRAKSSDKFYSETIIFYYRRDDPRVTRRQYRIVRRSDGKILGESISYGRGGGDIKGPWFSSSYQCPPISKKYPGLISQIFVKEGQYEHNK
jgi:hypothetical protein